MTGSITTLTEIIISAGVIQFSYHRVDYRKKAVAQVVL